MKRIFLIVLDSFGIGEAPDAYRYGDVGANTLRSLYFTDALSIPTLLSMGLGNIDGVDCFDKNPAPIAAHARMLEVSQGKDTTTGHWELCGVVSEHPMPTYPDGFPEEIISRFERDSGYGVLCNKPYSGTEVIRDFGAEHLKTGKLIVYTSADSVFQIAAHEESVPPDKLYDICKIARRILTGKHGVGRVIARPFIGDERDGFIRTANRRDFSLEPPDYIMTRKLAERGYDVIGVGKIGDIFAMSGITESYPTHSNAEGMQKTRELLSRDFFGLCFVNLVDFDMHYGHRQDAVGYAAAMSEFDLWLADLLPELGDGDMLIITADHGCDPSDNSTDHTREYVPLLMYGKGIEPKNLGTLTGFGNVAELIYENIDEK